MSKALSCFVFVYLTVLHDVIFGDYDGMLYFGSAALVDWLIAVFLLYIDCKTSERLQIICVVSVFLNFFGWMLWASYSSPLYYTGAYAVLYLISVGVMLAKDDNDVGTGSLVFWNNSVHRSNNSCTVAIGEKDDQQ